MVAAGYVSGRPYSFRMSEKNMERKVHQRGAHKAPLWKLPRCGGRNNSVPHNQDPKSIDFPSFSAQDAAASRRLFGATGIFPRNSTRSVNVSKNFLPQQAALRSQPPYHRRLTARSNKSGAFFKFPRGPGGRSPRSPFGDFPSIRKVTRRRHIKTIPPPHIRSAPPFTQGRLHHEGKLSRRIPSRLPAFSKISKKRKRRSTSSSS